MSALSSGTPTVRRIRHYGRGRPGIVAIDHHRALALMAGAMTERSAVADPDALRYVTVDIRVGEAVLVTNATVNLANISARGWRRSKPVTSGAKARRFPMIPRGARKTESPDSRAHGSVTPPASGGDREIAGGLTGHVEHVEHVEYAKHAEHVEHVEAHRMTRAEAIATANAALGAVARGLWRTAVYLGPLLVAALRYLAGLCADAVSAVRALLLRRARTKSPDRSPEYEHQEAALREANARRWTAWRALPVQRRFAVRVAAVVLVVAFGAMLRARFTTPSSPETTAAPAVETGLLPGNHDGAESPRPDGPRIGGPTTPEPDPRETIRRFKEGMAAATPGRWLVMDNPGLLPRGARAAWDGWGVGSPAVIEDADGRFRMWFRGCSFAARTFSCAIGHAVSTNGLDWTKSSEPVVVPGDKVERAGLNAVAVVRTADRYYLWYSVDEDWSAGRPRPVLYLATSLDGLAWDHAGAVLDPESADTLSIDHTALFDGAKFHLWFVDGGDLVHRSSSDGKHWAIEGATPVRDIDDHEHLGSLSVFRSATGTFEGISENGSGNQFMHFLSEDGNVWRVVLSEPQELRLFPRTTATLARRDGLWVWLSLPSSNSDRETISLAYMKRRP
jgi:hypothetical protein